MEEICEFLFNSDYEFSFEWINKRTYGDINPNENKVRVNVRVMLMETLLHEFYHHKYPKADEKAVERLAQARMRRLTIQQIYYLTETFVALWGQGGQDGN